MFITKELFLDYEGICFLHISIKCIVLRIIMNIRSLGHILQYIMSNIFSIKIEFHGLIILVS